MQEKNAARVTIAMKVIGESVFFLAVFLSSRLFGLAENGQFLILVNFLFISGQVVLFGLPSILLKRAAIYSAEGRDLDLTGLLLFSWLASLTSSFILCFILIVFNITVLQFLPAAYLFALIFGWALMIIHRDFLRGVGFVFRADLGFQILRPAGLVAFFVFAWALGQKPEMGNLILYWSSLLVAIAMIDAYTASKSVHHISQAQWSEIGVWIADAKGLTAATWLRVMLERGDVLLVSALLGVEEAAIYGVAARLAAVPALFLDPLRNTFRPRFATSYHLGDLQLLQRQVTTSTTWLIAAAAPILVLLVIGAPLIMSIFGNDYSAATTVLIVLAIGRASNAVGGLAGPLLNMTDQQKWHVLGLLTACVVLAVGICLSTTVLQSAIANATSWWVLNLMLLAFTKAQLGVSVLPSHRWKDWISLATRSSDR